MITTIETIQANCFYRQCITDSSNSFLFLQEEKLIKDDSSRLLHLESQIQPSKLEDMKPVHPPVQSQPMNFTSEPLTIKIPANSQGRQLIIDPRNQEEPG